LKTQAMIFLTVMAGWMNRRQQQVMGGDVQGGGR
jgi:hypothetical protein